jgi:O-succinylbenzoic acid--CoA ligase
MSETAGGCVYDGVPFPQVTVRISSDGRIVLSGPVLADGYVRVEESPTPGAVRITALPHPAAVPDLPECADNETTDTESPAALPGGFHGEGANRLLVTSDLGRWEDTEDGARRLNVLGRADDIIVTGGENVSPHEVESLLLPLAESRGFDEVLVTSRPHPEWGEQLVTLLVPAGAAARAAVDASGRPDRRGPATGPARPRHPRGPRPAGRPPRPTAAAALDREARPRRGRPTGTRRSVRGAVTMSTGEHLGVGRIRKVRGRESGWRP